jgi:transcriptional regulator with XRE-family HTH domain
MRREATFLDSHEHFAQQLRNARLKAGRSLDDIARATKISVPMLDRLERGDANELPADVFVCGFLRAYARELGLSGEESVARYRKMPRVEESPRPIVRDLTTVEEDDAIVRTSADPANEVPRPGSFDHFIARLAARVPLLEGTIGKGPAVALVVLLVVLVATITLSILLGGDPRPGRGLS